MEVLRRCPLAIAQRLVHCAIALSTAVLDRVTKTMSVAPLLMNNLDNSKQKTSNLLSPAPPPYSWSLLGKSEGPAPPPSSKISWSFDLAWSPVAAPPPPLLFIYPVNIADQIRKRFGSGQFWSLRPACSQNRAGLYMPDPTSRIRFSSVFSKDGMDHIVQNRPGSDLEVLVLVWPNASGLEASWCAGIIWPGFWQDATIPLPVSHFQTRFRFSADVPDNIVQNQPGSELVLADCVRFWPNGSGPEASRCARIIRPASGQCFPADPYRMRIGSGIFTGYIQLMAEEEAYERKKRGLICCHAKLLTEAD